jgi:predicted  nucleic acid-binding Zn-ribbon protein
VTPEPAPFDPLTFDPAALTDAELAALLNELEGEEETASRRRGSLHNRIEFVHAGGGASAEMAEDQLATMQTNERDLSGRRRALHLRIDLLRAERSRRLV